MASAERQGRVPRQAAAYRFWVRETIRFADLDLLGHVNNKSFLSYAESGRAAFLMKTGLWVPNDPRQSVIVHIEVDYLDELHYPGEVQVGVGVIEIGRSSKTVGVGLFREQTCVAVVSTVLVRMDLRSRTVLPLDEREREALAPYLLDTPAR